MSYINSPVLITGCARSGTSMTAGVIHICGAFGGKLARATQSNKKGMFENNIIRESIVKPILREHGFDPMGQWPLPDIRMFNVNDIGDKLRGRVLATMRLEGYNDDNKIWFYKGAKMCLIWQIWHRAFPEAKWIIVRRIDSGIIDSCLKTGFMSKFNGRLGWQKWINVHKERFKEMREAGLDVTEIWTRDMIEGRFDNIKMLINDLGLRWQGEKVLDFITPALWSNLKREAVSCE